MEDAAHMAVSVLSQTLTEFWQKNNIPPQLVRVVMRQWLWISDRYNSKTAKNPKAEMETDAFREELMAETERIWKEEGCDGVIRAEIAEASDLRACLGRRKPR